MRKDSDTMESATVTRFMRLIAALSTEMKLEILSKLSENLKADFYAKEDERSELLKEVTGAWSGTDDDLAEKVISSRTVSDNRFSLD